MRVIYVLTHDNYIKIKDNLTAEITKKVMYLMSCNNIIKFYTVFIELFSVFLRFEKQVSNLNPNQKKKNSYFSLSHSFVRDLAIVAVIGHRFHGV